jgi:hypothetical protein
VFDCGGAVRTTTVVKAVFNGSDHAARLTYRLVKRVEAIGTYSNRGDLCKKYAELCKRINESRSRAPLLRQNGPKPRSKRFLNPQDITDLVHRYQAGETTQRIGDRYGISKTRVANVLREQASQSADRA